MQFLSRTHTSFLRNISAALVALGLGAGTLAAQSLFSPAITVNDRAITYYELEQRALFLTVLNAPGNPMTEARKALIEERLKAGVLAAAGLELEPEEIEAGMAEFAQRANLSTEEFIQALAQAGVEEQTFRDFVEDGFGWREYIRARFLGRAQPTDAEIDRALATDGGAGGVRVLLSEIIMPVTDQTLEEVEQRALRISEIETTAAFSEEARRFSATQTASNGGRMTWMPLTNLPAPLRPQILALAPGEVTGPITLPNAIALFQLRDIQETDAAPQQYSAIEYAAYYIPGGRSPEALSQAAKIASHVDTCDDLYGVAFGQPEEVLERGAFTPGEIPQDIAVELAKLDEGEISTALTRSNGQTLMFLMMCGRTAAINEEASREQVASALRQRRLNAFADSFIDQLRADALIIEND